MNCHSVESAAMRLIHVLVEMMNTFVVVPWRMCSASPCSWWCLCCNRWLCWIALILVAIITFVFWLLYLIVPRLSLGWRLWIALLIESAWEVAENSSAIIDRYREATLALGYNGDTILNSLSDILLCGFGFWLARRIGWKLTLALFIATEVILAFWIRDGLLLNMLMLIHPIESIKAWQMGM